jgi:hypothetical protein
MLLHRWLLNCAQCGTVVSYTCYHLSFSFTSSSVSFFLALPSRLLAKTFHAEEVYLGYNTKFNL